MFTFGNTQIKNYSWLLLSILIIALDQYTKMLAVSHLQLNHSQIVTSFFNLTLLFNHGAAFSFLSEASGWQQWILSSVSILVSLGIIAMLPKITTQAPLQCLSLSLVLGGALGNLWDRLNYGYVIDFLHFHYQDWHFAVFNIADSAISIGTTLLIAAILFSQDTTNTD